MVAEAVPLIDPQPMVEPEVLAEPEVVEMVVLKLQAQQVQLTLAAVAAVEQEVQTQEAKVAQAW